MLVMSMFRFPVLRPSKHRKQNTKSRTYILTECMCRLTFTSTSLAGKKMVVQITNTGGDLGSNHFDLAMPGGGVGWFPQGCAKQFDNAWMGNQYGGYTDRNQCYILPEGMFRDGCFFRFDWFQNADNPNVEWREVSCPKGLVERSGCGRWSLVTGLGYDFYTRI